MSEALDPAGICEHEEIRAGCMECLGKPWAKPRKAPAPPKPTHSPRSAADPIAPLSGTKDISVPVFKVEPYLDEMTDWLLAQGYPHDLRGGGWLYLRCDNALRGRVRVRGMRWHNERPWRTGDDPDDRGAGPGLVFDLVPETWEPVTIELGELAESQRSGFRYLITATSGEVAHLMAQAPLPDGDWDRPYVTPWASTSGLIIELPRIDETKALSAISQLREGAAGAVTMADELEKAVRARRISGDVLARHTKWCDTSGRFASGMDPARSAASAIYGFVPERLIDSENKPFGDLESKLAEIKRRIESPLDA